MTVRVHWQAGTRPAGFIRLVNGAFVDDACKEFFPVGWNSCAHRTPHAFIPHSPESAAQAGNFFGSPQPVSDQRHDGNPSMSHCLSLLTLHQHVRRWFEEQSQWRPEWFISGTVFGTSGDDQEAEAGSGVLDTTA